MFRVISARATGKSHLAKGRGCDDAFSWSIREKQALFVVADGAGSEDLSALGAYTAVHALKEAFEKEAFSATEESMRRLFQIALTSIHELASNSGKNSVGSYATTLAVVLIDQVNCVIGQVGDCLIFKYGPDAEVSTISAENAGEYFNATNFITSVNALEEIRLTFLTSSDVQGFVMSTDGMSFQILDSTRLKTPFRPFFDDLFASLTSAIVSSESLQAFLLAVEDQSHDDKTILAAIRGEYFEKCGVSDPPSTIGTMFCDEGSANLMESE